MRINSGSKGLAAISPNDRGKPKDSEIREWIELPQTGLLRIRQVLRFVPISRSAWWQGVREGRYPQPLKLSERVTCWKAADIKNLVEGIHPSNPSIGKVAR
jgi:predicted DNA-binding transcriptional regulator AlpA